MSQSSWLDLKRLELVLFVYFVSTKNKTDEKRRHKKLFFFIFRSRYLTQTPTTQIKKVLNTNESSLYHYHSLSRIF